MKVAGEQRKQTRAAYQRSYRKTPEEVMKAKARGMVGQQIKSGRMSRQPCHVCGDVKSEAHHEDYSDPLNVEWLCRWHHAQRHGPAISEEKLAIIFERLRLGVPVKRLHTEVGVDPKVLRLIRDGTHPAVRKFQPAITSSQRSAV